MIRRLSCESFGSRDVALPTAYYTMLRERLGTSNWCISACLSGAGADPVKRDTSLKLWFENELALSFAWSGRCESSEPKPPARSAKPLSCMGTFLGDAPVKRYEHVLSGRIHQSGMIPNSPALSFQPGGRCIPLLILACFSTYDVAHPRI